MDWKKLIRSLIKWIFKSLWKLFVLAVWIASELFAVFFTAVAKYLKEYLITNR